MTNYEINNENNQNEYSEEPEANELHELYEMIKPLYEAELQVVDGHGNNYQFQHQRFMSLLEDSPLLPDDMSQKDKQLAARIEFVLHDTRVKFQQALLSR